MFTVLRIHNFSLSEAIDRCIFVVIYFLLEALLKKNLSLGFFGLFCLLLFFCHTFHFQPNNEACSFICNKS